MESSCLRCGRCCTQFGVCVTPFDVKRISEETGMAPIEFLDLIPDYKEREREEPAILIDGEFSILVLKRQIDDHCFFYGKKGCEIYSDRPALCRAYPYCVSSLESRILEELKSRSCIRKWDPQGKDKEQYLADCRQYKKEVDAYSRIAGIWNSRGGGSFPEFLKFISEAHE